MSGDSWRPLFHTQQKRPRIRELADQTERRMRLLELRQEAVRAILEGFCDEAFLNMRLGASVRFEIRDD